MGFLSKLFGSRALESQKNKKFRELEKDFGRRSLSNTPEMVDGAKAAWLTSRGNVLGSQNELDLAIRDFREAIALEPNHALAHISLALAYRAKGMFEEAIMVLENAPKKSRLFGEETGDFRCEIYLNLGLVYVDMGDREKAVEYLEQSLKANDERSRDAKASEHRQILKHIGGVGEQEEKNYQEMAEAIKQLLEELRE